jgi:hypothetical protein
MTIPGSRVMPGAIRNQIGIFLATLRVFELPYFFQPLIGARVSEDFP